MQQNRTARCSKWTHRLQKRPESEAEPHDSPWNIHHHRTPWDGPSRRCTSTYLLMWKVKNWPWRRTLYPPGACEAETIFLQESHNKPHRMFLIVLLFLEFSFLRLKELFGISTYPTESTLSKRGSCWRHRRGCCDTRRWPNPLHNSTRICMKSRSLF